MPIPNGVLFKPSEELHTWHMAAVHLSQMSRVRLGSTFEFFKFIKKNIHIYRIHISSIFSL